MSIVLERPDDMTGFAFVSVLDKLCCQLVIQDSSNRDSPIEGIPEDKALQ